MIPPHTVRIEFHSAFDMLDFVQVVSDHVCKAAGLDEDQLHWVSVAVRESGGQRHQAWQQERSPPSA
jgi:hypothetical protein